MSSLGFVRGGLETIAGRFASGLAEEGHRVTVVAGFWPGRGRPTDLICAPVAWIGVPCVPLNLSAWSRLAKHRPGWLLKAQSMTFAHACRLHPHVRRIIASVDVTLTLLELETVEFSAWRNRHNRPNVSYFPGVIDRQRVVQDRSAVRVAISQTIAQRYRHLSDFGIDGVVTPGVPATWLDVPYSVRQKVQTLIFVGRMESNKGVLELLRIFEPLAVEFPDLTLRILGDGPLRPALQAKIERAGLFERVLMPGSVPAHRIRQELERADLFVFPTHYESFGIAAVEAQAIGVPVIASDLPAIREAAGEAASLLPLEDLDAWVAVVRRLIRDRAERERMSRAGRQRARRFTWRQAVEDLEYYLRLAVDRYRE